MRQGQQNRRGRGRNNNNNNNNNNNSNQNRGKGQNPLSRSFESTGPDVKLRGTPAHIAEKYIALARDASTSGDPVLAENYLQHAEHYNRIIMAFREQNAGQSGDNSNGVQRPRHMGGPHDQMEGGDEFGEEEGGDETAFDPPVGQSSQSNYRQNDRQNDRPNDRQNDYQRNFDGPRYEDRGDRGQDRGNRNDHGHRQNRDRNDRDRNRFERNGDGRNFSQNRPFQPQSDQPQPPAEASPPQPPQPAAAADQPRQPEQGRRRERFAQPPHEQPEFLKRPVRRPRRENADAVAEVPAAAPSSDEGSED